MSKIHRPAEGVACYFEEKTGAAVLLTHHIADPLKRSLKWRREASTDPAYPEGEEDPRFHEEFDMSFTAARAKLIYYRFSDAYSLVEPFDIFREGYTRVVLTFDFGDHTYCGFYAQHPRTQQCVGFDELYWYKATYPQMQADVYEKLAALRHLRPDEFRANEVCEDIVGDPRGAAIARAFAEGDQPIMIRTKNYDGNALNVSDHMAGWAKVNSVLAPGFWHCRTRQITRDGGSLGVCKRCGKEPIKAVPLLVFMRGRMPYLEKTMPELERAESKPDEEESTKEKRGQADHAGDGTRYYVMRTSFVEPEVAERDILKEPIGKLTLWEVCRRKVLEHHIRQKKEQEQGLRDEFGYRVTAGSGDELMRITDAEGILRQQGVGLYDDDDD